MTTINLKEFYYWYITDELVEVPDEVAEALRAGKRAEAAHAERVRYNKAYYRWTVTTGSNTPLFSMSLPRRNFLTVRICFCFCGTHSTLCRKSKVAGWTPISFSERHTA